MADAAASGSVSFSGFLTADQHSVRDAFVAAILDECASQSAQAVIKLADARIARREYVHEPRPITRDELRESLVFYRRRLAEKLAVAMIGAGWSASLRDVPQVAEDMAHAIYERLAARETGDPAGYT